MQLSTPQQNQSPSLIQQDLPSYQQRMYLSSFHQADTSNQFSFNNIQKLINPFEGTTLQEQYRKFQKLKVSIFNQRNTLIKDYQLQHTNREAISTLPNYQQGQQRVRQQKAKAQELKQYNQQLKYQLQDKELQEKKLTRKKIVLEEVAEFQAKLKGSVVNKEQGRQQQLLQGGGNAIDYNQQLFKKLRQSLKTRSQTTLHKLKPYLSYSLQTIQQSNQTHKQNNQFLSQRKSKFDHQISLSKQSFTQEKNKIYELEDQIEDQMMFKRQIKVYHEQNKKDERLRWNKRVVVGESE